MLKWNCKPRSKEGLKINSHLSLLWPNTFHLLRWWHIICFLSEMRACFPWLMPALGRMSTLYIHAAFELWKGRGMKSKPSVLLIPMISILLGICCLKLGLSGCCSCCCNCCHATPPRGLCFRDGKGTGCNDDYDAGSYMHTCSKPRVVWFVVDSGLSIYSTSVRKEQLVRKLRSL